MRGPKVVQVNVRWWEFDFHRDNTIQLGIVGSAILDLTTPVPNSNYRILVPGDELRVLRVQVSPVGMVTANGMVEYVEGCVQKALGVCPSNTVHVLLDDSDYPIRFAVLLLKEFLQPIGYSEARDALGLPRVLRLPRSKSPPVVRVSTRYERVPVI